MTLLYRLFGKPGNVEELIDKAKKRGIRKINIKVERFENVDFGDFHCRAVLETGNNQLKLNEYKHHRMGILFHTVIARVIAEKNSVEGALVTAKTLLSSGFEVTIGGKSLSEVEAIMAEFGQTIQDECRKNDLSVSFANALVVSV